MASVKAFRFPGQRGAMGFVRGAPLAALAGLAAGVMVGCDQQDAGAQAISDASVQLKTVSPGSVPPVSDDFATKGYRAAAAELGPATTGTQAQQAIAALLNAEVESGLARPAMSRLAQIEHEIGSKLTRMMSLETARVSARQTAQALRGYDPSAERSTIDAQSRTLQQQLTEARSRREALEQQIGELSAQMEGLDDQVGGIRAQEGELRERALREDPIEAAQTIQEAREVGRRADRLEVEVSTLDARRTVLRPQVEALDVRIDAIDAQLNILSEARENVATQARSSTEGAQAADASAQEFTAQLVALAQEISALHQNEAAGAVDEARQTLQKSASSARRATGVVDGTLSAAGASRTLGDLLARRASSLEQTASAFRGLADRGEGELANRLSGIAGQLDQQAASLKQDAIAAFEQAASNLRRVRAQGDVREDLQNAADALDRAIERLGGRPAGGADDGGSDDGMGEDSASEMGG
ncbi:MAG: hypothetical protein RIB58_10380 [Phycisphaerales bacterium]